MVTIALAQMDVISGRPDLNTQTILQLIAQARQERADIVVFPELAVSGYLLGDTWEQPAFLRDCEAHGRIIAEASADMCIIFGNIAIDWTKTNDDGRVRKYNACFIAYNGQFIGGDNFPYPYRIKTLLPNYREFDDNRHFFSLRKLALELNTAVEHLLQPVRLTIHNQSIQLGCVICEDAWSDDYNLDPMTVIHANGPVDVFVNISSSPFTVGKNSKRNRIFSRLTRQINTPLVYVNNVGMQNNGKTIYTFDGSSSLYLADGTVKVCCPAFIPALTTVGLIPQTDFPSTPAAPTAPDTDIAVIYQALTYGITKFLHSIHQEKVVVGLSGGIDSAVAATLFTKILGPRNVLLVNMPSKFNSQTTQQIAAQLAHNLGCLYAVVPIQPAVELTTSQIQEANVTCLLDNRQYQLQLSPLAMENIQARDRSARVLAALAAAFGGVFSCNANKSEMTVGYSTLYGDQAGFLAPLADLWKHQIYALGRYLNTTFAKPVIPLQTFLITPSAELSAAQAVDEHKGDPLIYEYHDYLFRSFVEHWDRTSPEDILQWYATGTLAEKIGCQAGLVERIFSTAPDFIADLERWWLLYTGMAVAKRIQAPPVIAVSRRAFGFDHREAQNGPYFTAAYHRLKAQILGK